MESIAMIGFLVFLGSLVYLVYHFIRKIMKRERPLNKKIFYPILIGGFMFFFIGAVFEDTTLKDELDEALKTKIALSEENQEAQTKRDNFEKANEKMQKEIDKMSKEIDELATEVSDLDKDEQEFKKLQSVHKEKVTALEEEISTLKTTNSSLKDKVDNLK